MGRFTEGIKDACNRVGAFCRVKQRSGLGHGQSPVIGERGNIKQMMLDGCKYRVKVKLKQKRGKIEK